MADVALARRLVTRQFPQWAGLPVRPVELDGWDNRTFRLGDALSIRMPSAERYVLQVEKEHRWLPVLAPHLPLPIPQPVALGRPDPDYPFPWSVYRWLDGTSAASGAVRDLTAFARAVGGFLVALRRIDATDGPEPGAHNFLRGGHVSVYGGETFEAVAALGSEIPRERVLRAWDVASATRWTAAPVWLHGDVAAGNLLLRDGRLAAVIDFGTCGVGDPACDVVLAWTFLDDASRAAFRATLGLDDDTWARGRGWALWKALITLVRDLEADRSAGASRAVIDAILAES